MIIKNITNFRKIANIAMVIVFKKDVIKISSKRRSIFLKKNVKYSKTYVTTGDRSLVDLVV